MSERLDTSTLLELTTEIVSAYVSNNQIMPSEIEAVIGTVAGALAASEKVQEPVTEKLEPAVPVRRSVATDHVACLLCGKKQKLLKRHLATAHQMTPAEYRQAFDLKPDYPMVAPGYAQQRSELARQIGLGRKPAPPTSAHKAKGPGKGQSGKSRTAGTSAKPKPARTTRGRKTALTQRGAVTKSDQTSTNT